MVNTVGLRHALRKRNAPAANAEDSLFHLFVEVDETADYLKQMVNTAESLAEKICRTHEDAEQHEG